MLCKPGAVCNSVEHDHHLIVLKCFDLSLAGFRDSYRIESVRDVPRDELISVELFEHDGHRRLLTRQGFVVVLIIVDRIVRLDFIFSGIVDEEVHV